MVARFGVIVAGDTVPHIYGRFLEAYGTKKGPEMVSSVKGA